MWLLVRKRPIIFRQPAVSQAISKTWIIPSLVLLQLVPALAWVFPEHRDIAAQAVQRLSAAQQAQLQKLWLEARIGHESRLCQNLADDAQGTNPTCIDFAAWTAIAGDHSCSARDMLGTVLDAPWILSVAKVSAHLKVQLAAADRRDQRVNAVRVSNISLQRTDPEYATRASSNNAHFVLARPSVSIEPVAYAQIALGGHSDLNALATYLWYHLRALRIAERLSKTGTSGGENASMVRAALADEAFALHFLEDSFAAGHVTGNWGTTAVRLGTHDYYNEHGVALASWNGQRFVALGDAYMRPEDADRASAAVRDSLAQFLDAFNGTFKLASSDDSSSTEPEPFDVCHATSFNAPPGVDDDLRAVVTVIAQTPVPALGAGLGELPRFRAELGPFVGLSSALRLGALTRGFGPTQTDASGTAGLDAAVRFGIGLEGVLNESSDGLTFVEVGVREDRHAGGIATVPGRGALTLRLRMPFWLIPGDLLVAGPILAFTSKTALTKMAVQSANGGLIPWQSGIETRVGRLQFMLGREVSVSFYRNDSDHPVTISTPGVPPLNATAISLHSFQLEFPVMEYRLFRAFSSNQSSGLILQPYVGFDKPTSWSVVSPVGAPNPRLQTIVTAGLRVVFDWRHYVQ